MEENKPVKKRPILLIVALGFFGVAIMAGISYFQWQKGFGGDYNATLFLSAKGMNLACPRMLENGVRLDSVAAKYDLQLLYYYTLTTAEKDDETNGIFCEEYEAGIIDNLDGNKDLDEFGRHNVTMIFNLRDKNGAEMCSVVLPPGKYYNATPDGQ